MRSKLCEDGKRRILAKVEVPMAVDDILTFALAHPVFSNTDEAMNEFENLNKRQIFNLAKETIKLYGTANDSMSETSWTPKQITRARNHVQLLFPEVD